MVCPFTVQGNCCGSVDTLVDAAGNRTHWECGVLGRKTGKWLRWQDEGQVRVETIDYDSVGRVWHSWDARGNLKTYGYNAEGRLGGIAYTLGTPTTKPTPNVTITYEPVYRRLDTVSDTAGLSLRSTYVPMNPADAVYGDGSVARETRTSSAGAVQSIHNYTYDKLGRQSSGPRQTGAEWDVLGRLTQLSSGLGWLDFAYQFKSGRLLHVNTRLSQASPALSWSSFTYEPGSVASKARRLTGILHQRPTGPTSGTVFGQHGYQYDTLGRLSLWQKWADAAQSHWANIQHDDEDQLPDLEERDGVDTLRGSFGFGYDAAGNRTRATRWTMATGTVNRVWSANGLNQLTAQTTGPESGPPITYDADGNMLSALRPPNSASAASAFAYEWDAENRLVAVNYGGGKRVAWTYDALHRRAKQTDTVPGIVKVRDLTWDGLTLIGSRDPATGEDRRYYPNGEERQTGTGPVLRLFYTRDHLGSIREVVDATGAIRARYDYTPYGERIKLSGDLDCDFGFTGHYTHEATGLVAAPYRFYDPVLGRWLSRDPIEDGEFLPEGPNLYRYVANAPVMFTDPDGRVIPLIVAGGIALWGMTQHAEAPAPSDPVIHRSPPYAGACAGILIGGGVWGSLPKVQVAVGAGAATSASSGAGVHVAWGAGGTWLHAVGQRIGWKAMLTVSRGAEAFAQNAWFRFSIPVLSQAAALASKGERASSCVSAAASGVAAGWWTPIANAIKQILP